MTTTTPLRANEFQMTREFSGATPVWTTSRVLSFGPDVTTFAVACVGETKYAVRHRKVDVYGQVSDWSTPTEHTTIAGPDSVGVQNVAATIVIDADGLHVFDGAIFIVDQNGESVLTANGFQGTWLAFLYSGGVYNSDFTSDAGSDPLNVSEVGTGSTVADYEASIAGDLPFWVVSEITKPTYRVINTAATTSGRAIESIGGAGTTRIYQDVSIVPFRDYVVEVSASISCAAGGNLTLNIYGSWRDATHAIIGSRVTLDANVYVNPDTTGGYIEYLAPCWPTLPEPPADARYLRVEVEDVTTVASASMRIGQVRVSDAPSAINSVAATTVVAGDVAASTVTTQDIDIEGTIGVFGPFDGKGDLWAGTADDAGARLAVGANDTILVADSAQATGLKWVAPGIWNAGSSFPASPATNDRYHRTDLHMTFFWNGSRWLSEQLFTADLTIGRSLSSGGNLPLSASSNDAEGVGILCNVGTDLWIENYYTWFFVGGGGSALSGSHRWVGTISKVGTTGAGMLAIITIDSGSSSVFRHATGVVNNLVGVSGDAYNNFTGSWIKFGTPGALYMQTKLTYRVVQT